MVILQCASAHDAVATARLYYDLGHDVAAYSVEQGAQHGVLCGRAAARYAASVTLEFDPSKVGRL